MNTVSIPQTFLTESTSSFTKFLGRNYPELLPTQSAVNSPTDLTPTATTIVAVTGPDGVVMVGDRRATMGSMIAARNIQKVYIADDYSAIGIAGAAGLGMDFVRLFRLELEHYEKIEGIPLTLEGKSNRLASMIRNHLPMALQGFVIMPIFVGWDLDQSQARIFSIDPTGGLYEETDYYAVGSGSVFARGSLKKLYNPAVSIDQAVEICIHALFDAADDDSATGGPDVFRKIYPVVLIVTKEGARRMPEDDVIEVTQRVLDIRAVRPDGPEARL